MPSLLSTLSTVQVPYQYRTSVQVPHQYSTVLCKYRANSWYRAGKGCSPSSTTGRHLAGSPQQLCYSRHGCAKRTLSARSAAQEVDVAQHNCGVRHTATSQTVAMSNTRCFAWRRRKLR